MSEKIPPKMRAQVLYEAGYKTPKSLLRRGGIPVSTGKRYIRDFKEGKSWERKPYAPRKNTKVTPKLVRKVEKKAKDRARIWSSRTIGASEGISHTLAQTIMKDVGLHYSKYKRKMKLTPEVKSNRVKFARDMQKSESDWGFTFITDECSFWLSKSKPDRLWTEDPLKEDGTGVHGGKVHCWGGISARGALKLEIFESNMDSDDYLGIIKKKRPQMTNLYPEGFIWQQDGSGVHRANKVKEYNYKNMPQILDWPAYSPDLSPIENIWGWLKGEVSKDCPKTVYSLKRCIQKHWNRINVEFLAPYFDSMPDRMAMVIENEGGKINY